MLPLICVYRSKENIEPYINLFSRENGVQNAAIFRIIPEKRVVHLEQLQQLMKLISTSNSHKRLFVIPDLDLAGPPVQNILLKTLEEKKESDYFLLFVTQPESVVTTIRSRCNVIYIESETTLQSSAEIHAFVESLLKEKSISVLSDPLVVSMNQDKGLAFLDEFLISARAYPATSRTASILKDALQTKLLLQSNNLNPQLAIDAFLLRSLQNT